jgi:hypothetical protein
MSSPPTVNPRVQRLIKCQVDSRRKESIGTNDFLRIKRRAKILPKTNLAPNLNRTTTASEESTITNIMARNSSLDDHRRPKKNPITAKSRIQKNLFTTREIFQRCNKKFIQIMNFGPPPNPPLPQNPAPPKTCLDESMGMVHDYLDHNFTRMYKTNPLDKRKRSSTLVTQKIYEQMITITHKHDSNSKCPKTLSPSTKGIIHIQGINTSPLHRKIFLV